MATDSTRERILQAAGEQFANDGFAQATIRAICCKAGVNLAAANYYFGDKERLYIEAVKHARRLREKQAPLPNWTSSTPADKKLRQFVLTLLRRMLCEPGDPWQTRLIIREIMEPTKACEEMVQEAFQPLFQVLIDILQEMMPETTPLHTLHHWALSVIGQCFYYRANEKILTMLIDGEELRQQFTVEKLSEHITEVILRGLGHLPPISRLHPVTSSRNIDDPV
ncbi:MAG: CerR family C-terminal domain-containing protein [Planctomycetota bacterium]|nr:CerR family C-terminal domain-containing protein [Planctomycetota bacterium]